MSKIVLTAALIAASIVAAGHARAGEACPAAVAASIAKAFPASAAPTCTAEARPAGTVITALSATGDGRKLQIEAAPDGRLLQSIEGLNLAEVPHEVLMDLNATSGAARPAYVDRITRTDGRVVYRVTLSDGKAKTERVFDADWKPLGRD